MHAPAIARGILRGMDRMDEIATTDVAGDAACEVCRVQLDAVARRIGWIEAEGLNDGPFLHRFVASGGYCPRHLRQVLGTAEGGRWAVPLRLALHEVGRQTAAASAGLVFDPCPLCELETWTGEYAVSVLASGRTPVTGGARHLGPGAFVCLRHAAEELLVRPGSAALERLQRALGAASSPALHRRLAAVAGLDPAGAIRAPASGSDLGAADVSAAPALSPAWLRAEVEADRCPACSAAVAAEKALLQRDRGPAEVRLCAHHAWDAAWAAPALVEEVARRAVDGARSWADAHAAGELPLPAPGTAAWPDGPPARGRRGIVGRLTGRQRAAAAGRPCTVCLARAAAVGSRLRLLDSQAEDISAARGWRGLCVRHLLRAAPETRAAWPLLLAAAHSASGDLERALVSGHDPSGGALGAGPAIRDAAACLAGDAVVRDPWYSPEVPGLGPSIWPL